MANLVISQFDTSQIITKVEVENIVYREDYEQWKGQKFLRCHFFLDMDRYYDVLGGYVTISTLTLYPVISFKVGDISKLFYSGCYEGFNLNIENSGKTVSMIACGFPLPIRQAPLDNEYTAPIGAGISINYGELERLGEQAELDQKLIQMTFSGDSEKYKGQKRFVHIIYDIPLNHLYTMSPIVKKDEYGIKTDNVSVSIDSNAVLFDNLSVILVQGLTPGLWNVESTYNGIKNGLFVPTGPGTSPENTKWTKFTQEIITHALPSENYNQKTPYEYISYYMYQVRIPQSIMQKIGKIEDEIQWAKNNLKVYIIKSHTGTSRLLFVNIPCCYLIYRNQLIGNGGTIPAGTKYTYIGNGPRTNAGDGSAIFFPYVSNYGLMNTSGMSCICCEYSQYDQSKIWNATDEEMICDSIKDNTRCLNNYDLSIDFKIINKYYYGYKENEYIDFGTGSRNIPLKTLKSTIAMDVLGLIPSFGTIWTN